MKSIVIVKDAEKLFIKSVGEKPMMTIFLNIVRDADELLRFSIWNCSVDCRL